MSKPPWNNRKAVKAWANQLLDERLYAEIRALQERPFPTEEEYHALLQPAWIGQAIRRRDIDSLVALTAAPAARRLAFEQLLIPPRRGRPPGPTTDSLWVEEAAREVDFLIDAFAEHFERRRGTQTLANEIVAERHAEVGVEVKDGAKQAQRVTEDRIVKYRRDQSRKDREN